MSKCSPDSDQSHQLSEPIRPFHPANPVKSDH